MITFRPFSLLFGDVQFWQAIADLKKESWKLDTSPKEIYAYIDSTNNRLCFSLQKEDSSYIGTLVSLNSLEELRSFDKKSLISSISEKIKSVDDLSALNQFVVIVFSNLKTLKNYVLSAVPVISPKVPFTILKHVYLSNEDHEKLTACSDKMFFMVDESSLELADKGSYFVYKSPFTFQNSEGVFIADWTLRNYLFWILSKKKTKVFSLLYVSREKTIKLDISCSFDDQIAVLAGWEQFQGSGKVVPKVIDLSNTMDPSLLMRSAVDLNLKLMNWRSDVNFNFGMLEDQKCLLLGAGTLGCNVSRMLMAWGFKKITFVDSGTVSYSNPIRQSLFVFEDCKGSRNKAECAANRLLQINPTLTDGNVKGINAHIPMPGHLQITLEDIQTIDDLIQENDVIFVLTDSREGRWLPSFLGANRKKIVVNVALGFDSYLAIINDYYYGRERTGCYFCSDVVAPSDSITTRTMDQQCTVIRPGVSAIASSLAVELLVDYLQTPGKGKTATHIRGFLSDNYQNHVIKTSPFDGCICCSGKLSSEFQEKGLSFVLSVLENPVTLERITGLEIMKQDLHEDDILALE